MIEILIAVVPLLALVVSLLFGFYPGCEAAMRLAERIAARGGTAVRAATRSPRPRRPMPNAANGGLLLAFSLSGRAPPA